MYLKIQWLFKNINAQELVLEVQADSSGCKKKDSDDLDPPVSGSKSDDGSRNCVLSLKSSEGH